MRKQKTYFFTGVDGPTGHLFRTGNKPKRADYETLLDSVPFILDVADTAKENESGHIKIETDSRAIGRSLPAADGFSRAVLAHQLPVVKGALDAGDVVVSTTTVSGITIKEVTRNDGTRIRRDYVVTSGLSLTSAAGSIVITPIANGFNLEVNPAIVDNFTVKADAGDVAPGYLDAKVGNGLTVNGAHQIVPVIDSAGTIVPISVGINGFLASLNTSNTNTIQLIPGVSLSSNLRYNATWFTEDGTGLRLLPHGITQNEIALGTIRGTNINTTPGFFFGDGLNHDGTRMYARVQKSIELDATGGANIKPIQLVGDLAVPGLNMFYSTDGAGIKGWYAIPPASDSKWKTDASSGISTKGGSGEAMAPKTVAVGYKGYPWIYGALGNGADLKEQQMQVLLRGTTVGVAPIKLTTEDSKGLWFPDKCSGIVEGTVIGTDVASGDTVMYKFSCSVKFIAGALVLSNVHYLDTSGVAPVFINQSGMSPAAAPYYDDLAGSSDMMLTSNLNELEINVIGVVLLTLSWTASLNIHILGYDTFTIPPYTP